MIFSSARRSQAASLATGGDQLERLAFSLRLIWRLALATFAMALWFASTEQACAESGQPIAMVAAQIDRYDSTLQAIGRASRDPSLDDAILRDKLAEIPPIDQALDAIVADLTARTAAIDERLAQLGPAPSPGQPPEAVEISQERTRLVTVRQAIDTEAKQARVLTVVTDQLTTHLADRRRAMFAARLWNRSGSILDPRLWVDFVEAVPGDLSRLRYLQQMQARQWTTTAPGEAVLAGWAVVLSIAGLILFPGYRLLLGVGNRFAEHIQTASRLRRSALAMWVVVATMGAPLLAGLLLSSTLDTGRAFTGQTDAGFRVIVRAAVFAALVYGLGRALLAADRPSWRLAPISDDMVQRVRRFPLLIAITVGLSNVVAGLNSAFGISLATSIITDALTLLLELAVIGKALLVAAHSRVPREPPQSESGRRSQLPWVIAALAGWISLIWALGAVIVGYLALATFLVRETVWIATVLASLFLLIRLGDDLLPALLGSKSSSGRFVGSALGLPPSALDQIAILLAGLIRVALLLFGWAAIVAPFGAGATDMFSRISSTDLVLRFGAVSISPGAIVGGLLLFLLGLLVTRAIRSWVETEYLPSTTLDIGVRTSLAAAVTYLGAFVAVVVASAYLGLSLDRITLLASALSVGIGFGLQAMIGNFVSGLILLMERPVKVGDWIAIGDLEGDVKRIKVRATEIEMRDRSRLIVPNSELVTKTVRNVTHGEALGRIRIVLTVNDDADVLSLKDLLLAHLTGHSAILREPPPQVFFSDARDGGLEFTCFAYVASARQAFAVRSDLLFAIVPDLRAKGFALSNSTPIVNVGLGDRPIEPSAPAQ